ncbi:c-type cytochrome [Thiohalorhabdus sp.]|uniref:c-type cytochrome n=1 Tax=Thiohalorhabdus sp. TaxID=3094134 RepID=UPI002FC281D2
MRRARGGNGQKLGAAIGLVLLLPAAAAQTDGEPADKEGEGLMPPAVQVCLGCHSLDPTDRRGGAGPPLRGVVGRTPSVDGVTAARWNAQLLDRWLANPRALDPDTESRFPGYADPAMRESVIRFLEGLQ